jgi:tetratricopeptide (TPR) repeat protein
LDVYIQADEDDKAADLAEKILDENRFDEKIAIQVVARLSKGWSTEEVAAFSDSYREKHPDDFRTMYARARVLAGRGMAEEAGALFVALAENGAHYSQIYEAAAVYLLDKGDVYRAVVLLLNGVENGFVVRPELFTERFVALAGDAGALAERLEGVVGDCDTALVQLQEIIGALYGSVDNDVKAEEYFRETLKDASPKLTNYVGLVLALYGQDRVDEAIEVVEEIIGKGQGAPPVLRMLVMMLSDEGRIKEAEQLARRIVAEGPTDVENRMALVGVLIDRSDYAAAEQELLRARSLAEGDEDLLLRVRYFLGIVYEEQGKGDLAMSMWQANITVDPGHADSNNAIAYHWAEAGENLPTALAYVKKALESDPESAPFLDTLGWIHYKMGNYEDAARELQKAADKLDDPVILDHLGDALLRLDKTESALEAWKSALENDPQPDDRSAIERKIEEHSSGGNSKGDSAGGDNGGS